MRMFTTIVIGLLILSLTVSSPAFAQERHVVDPAALAGAVVQHVSEQDADRAAIREALARPEVRDTASKVGLDLSLTAASLDTLSGSELQRAADAARNVNQSLIGGASNVTISTTTLIIVLLVVILIVVAVK
jgi:hypothetical protein